jgi:hypothetical protein
VNKTAPQPANFQKMKAIKAKNGDPWQIFWKALTPQAKKKSELPQSQNESSLKMQQKQK